jgi:ribosomal protein S18 acetylase RimI-like enzyme
MNAAIKDFSRCSPAGLYALYREVYSSSTGMSETLEEKYPSIGDFIEAITALQRLPGAVALAAEIDGAPAAFLTLRPRNPSRLRHTADLNMGVAAAARGRGLGRLILEAGIARASHSPEIEIIYLMVRSDNLPAIRLYETAGFERLALLERDTKIDSSYYNGLLMRRFVTLTVDGRQEITSR